MQGAYGGLIIIVMYGSNAVIDEDYLITQDNIDILTQTSNRILVEEQE